MLEHCNYVGGISFGGEIKFVKFFKPRSIVMMNGVKFFGPNLETHNIDTFKIPLNGVTLLASDTKIENYFLYAKKASDFLFSRDIQDLFIKSEYFREISANEILRPLANEIISKKERSQENQNFKYDFVDFLHDKEQLNDRIDSFNIKIKMEDIFADAKIKLRTGTLF